MSNGAGKRIIPVPKGTRGARRGSPGVRVLSARRAFFVWLLLVALVFALVTFREGALSYAVFYTVIGLLPAYAAYVIYIRVALNIFQELSLHKVTKGAESEYSLIIENTGFLPVNGLEPLWETELSTPVAAEDYASFSLPPRSRIELSMPMICRYAGTYEIGVKGFTVRECFGLFALRIPCPAAFRAVVRPAVTGTAEAAMAFRDLDSVARMRHPLEKEPMLTGDLRPYIPGDRLHAVHWKNYAHSGELFTRTSDDEETREVRLGLIPADEPRTYDEYVRRDAFLEFSVSAASFFSESRRQATFIYPRDSVREQVVADEESFYQFYEAVSDGMFYGSDKDREALRAVPASDDSVLVLFIRETSFTGGEKRRGGFSLFPGEETKS